MWPYWLLLLGVSYAALSDSGSAHSRTVPARAGVGRLPWVIFAFVLTVFIGLRVEVGGDWDRYLVHLEMAGASSFTGLNNLKDPGYQLLNFLSSRAGLSIWGVNTACGLIVSLGLVIFCRSLPRPWLAAVIAVPYLIVVVAMGYSRQGVALGLVMIGFVALGQMQIRRFVAWVLLAAAFHKSAVVVLPLAILVAERRLLVFPFLLVIGAVAYLLFLDGKLGGLYRGYVVAEYQSAGALVRTLMNALPALIFLCCPGRFGLSHAQTRLWRWCAIGSLCLLALVIIIPATTAVDRIALFFIPMQLVVFSQLPGVFGKTPEIRKLLVVAVITYYALIQYVWLNYAIHVHAWLPYRNWLVERVFQSAV